MLRWFNAMSTPWQQGEIERLPISGALLAPSRVEGIGAYALRARGAGRWVG